MRTDHPLTLSLICCILAAPCSLAVAEDGPKPPQPDAQTPEPKPADGDAPLPEGFPGATPPGAIEVKDYPAYRSAVARAEGVGPGVGDMLFFPLFNHISRRGVAMTAPVINTYESIELVAEPGERGEVSMEFLYGRPDQGEPGPGVGTVQVEDHPAMRVVSLGLQGRMTEEILEDGLSKLQTWLDEHANRWKAVGPPRRLGYHGPMTPSAQRLWEIQIPIEPAAAGDEDAPSPRDGS